MGEYYTAEKGGADEVERGQSGERTRSAQDALVRIGLLATSSGKGKGRDGLFGPKTEQAIREFQERQGMPVTGKLDRATEKALADTAPGGDPGAEEDGGGKVPPAVAKRLASLDADQREEVIRRARKLAETLRGAKSRPGAPRLDEDKAPPKSKKGARLVEFIGGPNSNGVAVYADGSIYDGDGWQ